MFDKSELIRVVRDPDGSAVIDPTGKKAGRGAYICKSEKCIAKSIKTRAVSRNLKIEADTELYKKIEEEYHRD